MPKFLLLRGLSRESRHWEGFPALLERGLGAAVQCVDAPGFGSEHRRVSPRTIAAITDDIRERFGRGGPDWTLLGVSLGGMVALDWCARRPEDFGRVVVVNTSTAATPFFRRLTPSALPEIALGSFKSDVRRELAILQRVTNHPASDRGELAERWAGYIAEQRPSHTSLANQILAAVLFRMPKHVSTPALVLAAREDRLVSASSSETIAARLRAPIRYHETAGHDLTLDDGPWVVRQIADWLRDPAAKTAA
ncbi:alpha/beta hydrolase fold protein [Segniliparus rotundus DSM 44985]|uniref:Alpha/beta hydrolase fold protein n=1 Tax=Segniliparus rotundus (strain ATCC BAA-972 / CDC 1076 / CIP 108378 / DSM 44985 / JCM 13578) TaxID=640132 RepID=D6Z862_SEGRD|nr:alpha/beta hydrolase [Segniliparus rotundus]ADG98142.1 alpha/beta hydrolase fold protein [Segniliparus rotundus DSM 44985]